MHADQFFTRTVNNFYITNIKIGISSTFAFKLRVHIVVLLKCRTSDLWGDLSYLMQDGPKQIISLLNRYKEAKERSVVPCVPWPFNHSYATSLSHVEKCGSCVWCGVCGVCGVCSCPVEPWSWYDRVNQSSYRGSTAQRIPQASCWLGIENSSFHDPVVQFVPGKTLEHINTSQFNTSDKEFISIALPVWNKHLVKGSSCGNWICFKRRAMKEAVIYIYHREGGGSSMQAP